MQVRSEVSPYELVPGQDRTHVFPDKNKSKQERQLVETVVQVWQFTSHTILKIQNCLNNEKI